MPSTPPLLFDRRRLRVRRDQAALSYHQYDFLKRRVSNDILERLDDVPRAFPKALDLGSHDGHLAKALSKRTGTDWTVACDLSERFAAACPRPSLVGDESALPFAEGSFDLVVSALSLHWIDDLPGALIQARRALKPDGLFLAALFGAGTLRELRTCFLEAETSALGGAGLRIAPLPGLQDAANLLQRAGFSLPVADVEKITVRYDTPFHLMADLKGMGERAAFAAPAKGGLSRRILVDMAKRYAEQFADPDGRLRASFEIIHIQGWSPGPGQPKPLAPGSAKTSLADAVRTRASK